MLFNERLRAARARLGVGQKAIAEAIGVHVITYAKWEGGRSPKTSDLVHRAAEALGVRVEWLASGAGPMIRRKRAV